MYSIVNSKQPVAGSIKDVANRTGQLTVDVIMNIELLVVFDRSGSMHTPDAPGGARRWDYAFKELVKLQENNPGKVLLVSFAHDVGPNLNGVPDNAGGGTALDLALQYVAIADGVVPIVVISDGEPDSEEATLRAAKFFHHKIDCIYAGPPDGYGAEFLQRLANATGGTFATTVLFQGLEQKLQAMLEQKP